MGADQSSVYPPRFRRAFLAPRYWPIWLGVGLLLLLAWSPWPLRSALAALLGELSYLSSGKRRRIARVNLRLCYPELDEARRRRLLRRHFRYRMRCFLDYGILAGGGGARIRRLVRLRGEKHFRAHHDQGRPIILLTCHSVALDFGAASLTLRYPGVGLVKPAGNPLADWFMQRSRSRFNADLHVRRHGLRPVVRAVRRGSFFYYLPDEDLGGRDSTFASFFGVPAATLNTLGRLAKLCDAVVLPSATYYVPGTGRYETRLFPALEGFPTDSADGDAGRMNRELEQLIRLHPEQYMWTMKLFKTRPAGETSPYDGPVNSAAPGPGGGS